MKLDDPESRRVIREEVSAALVDFDGQTRQAILAARTDWQPIAAAPKDGTSGLTFDTFSAVNRLRCESPDGFNHLLSSWSTSDWFTAIIGELREAVNVAKKLNRARDGIRGNKESEQELRDKLRSELADTFVYLDLLCQALGFSLGEAATAVFNAKSKEIGCSILMPLPDPPQETRP